MTTAGQIALVTGANKGIGNQIAAQLGALGSTVLVAARDQERGEKAAAALRADGHDARAITLDVTDPASAAAAAERVEREFGRLDVLVNNAGIATVEGRRLAPSETDLDTIRTVFETNVFGVVTVTNALLPLLLRAPAPRIVNVSSGLASLSLASADEGPLADLPASATYIPSKVALNGLTVQYAKQLRGKVLVNAADPGYCATDLNNHSGFRTAAQGAAIAVRLATLGEDGPTGGFFNDEGPIPW
jgi:NAD(P)-dependent dehydrogenase (short-subunit alcohol dehydrogenase family)